MRNRRILGAVVGVLVVAIVAFLAVGLIFEDSLPGRLLRGTAGGTAQEPTYAEATVDGNIGEWDLAGDFFADMYRAGSPSKGVEGKLYLRYDCGAGIVYALVMSAGDWPVLVQSNEAWIAVGSSSAKVSFLNFAWVDQGYDGNTGHARGWEASFPLAQGTYTIWAHINVDHGGSQTAATDRAGIGLLLDCYTPTAVFLSSFSGQFKEGSVLLTWETASEVNNLGFYLYQGPSASGPWTKINREIIPSSVAPGSPVGARYQYVVQNTVATNWFMLEDVDASGAMTQHDPIQPTVR